MKKIIVITIGLLALSSCAEDRHTVTVNRTDNSCEVTIHIDRSGAKDSSYIENIPCDPDQGRTIWKDDRLDISNGVLGD